MSAVLHGGRLAQAVEKYGGVAEKWLDLSTGVNPAMRPVPELEKSIWHRLPDSGDEEACRQAARQAYGAAEMCHVSLAPGSQMHLQVLPHLYKPQPVAIVGFTYQEHGVCWQRAGHEVYVTDGLESAEATARIVIVVNPNNPDGRIIDKESLIALSRRLAAKGGLLVVDEAFADVTPNASIASEAGRDGLLVLRSLGKFFGLAGVRLGIGLTNESLGQRLDAALGPWAVSGAALKIGTDSLLDTKWQKKALKKLQTQRQDLETLLSAQRFKIIGGTALFVLASYKDATNLVDHLGSSHILVRPFVGKPDWIRFGIPGRKPDMNRLEKSLTKFNSNA